MARDLSPACRKCRAESIKLMLKGLRCETAKCPMERQGRNMPPGMHKWRRGNVSDYGVRLREKQKVKRYYGVLEKQFLRYFRRSAAMRESTGSALLALLERRMDNVVYKLGYAPSRRAARQMISHGHIYINGRKVDRPSYEVKQGDLLVPKPSDRSQKFVRGNLDEEAKQLPRQLQAWLQLDGPSLTGTVVALPNRDDVQIPVEEQLIVELLSK